MTLAVFYLGKLLRIEDALKSPGKNNFCMWQADDKTVPNPNGDLTHVVMNVTSHAAGVD